MMISKTSRAAKVGLSFSVAGGILPVVVLLASLARWVPSSPIRGVLVSAMILCAIVGMAVSLLAKRDIERSKGQLSGGGLATVGALVGLVDLLLMRMILI